MNQTLILSAALAPLATLGPDISTAYEPGRVLRIESETITEIATTDFEMLRDGEPLEAGFGGGDRTSEEVRKVVTLDRIVEAADGQPLTVHRTFEEVSRQSFTEMGGEPRENELEGPLTGVTLEIKVDDEGLATSTVLEGDEQDGAALDGHRATLALDALLPPSGTEVGGQWELTGEAFLAAMGMDLEQALFPAPERGEGPPEGGRGGGGRRGMRGRRGSALRSFLVADWEGEATYVAEADEEDGLILARVEFKLQAEGELEDQGFMGRGRRGRSLDLPSTRPALFETTYSIEVTGQLTFDVNARRPAFLEIEGTIETDRNTERETRNGTMTISMTQEGGFSHEVTITEETEDE